MKTSKILLSVFLSFAVLLSNLVSAEIIRVACIGDSLTNTSGSGNNSPYPNQLGNVLGPGYKVGGYYASDGALQGFAKQGTSLMDNQVPVFNRGILAYTLSDGGIWYNQSRDFAPNIVVIMLGSNDAAFMPGLLQSWSQTYSAQFINTYKSLIAAYRALPSRPEVYICKPAYMYYSGFSHDVNVVNNVLPGLIDQVAAQTQTQVIDVQAATKNMPQNFYDGVHPNNEGSRIMADTIGNFILSRPLTRATFVKTDATTKGNWKGVYGKQAWVINQEGYYVAPSIGVGGGINGPDLVWANPTSDGRALQKPQQGATNRVAAAWSSGATPGSSFDIHLNCTDGNSHQVALYVVDWTDSGRSQTIEVRDYNTNRVLDTQAVTAFAGGKYLVWNVLGNVCFRVVNTNGGAVVSGEFIDEVEIPLGQVISLQAKSNNLFVAAENAGASSLIARSGAVGSWEEFQVLDLSQGSGNDAVALRSIVNNKYVCADINLTNPPQLIANRTGIGSWETFTWSTFADGAVALNSKAFNLFVSADPLPRPLTAVSPFASGWEAYLWKKQ